MESLKEMDFCHHSHTHVLYGRPITNDESMPLILMLQPKSSGR